MKRLFVLCALFTALPGLGQEPATGYPPFGSFANGGFDAVSRANLNVNFAIPIVSVPGRGLGFSQAIVHDSLIWMRSGNTWAPVTDASGAATWGWKKDFVLGTVKWKQTTGQCYGIDGEPEGITRTWSNYSYTDPAGTRHDFPTVSAVWSGCAMDWITSSDDYTGPASDTSGYSITITPGFSPAWVVYAKSGIKTTDRITDTNGNYISSSTANNVTTWQDTAGHEVLKIDKATPNVIYYRYQDSVGQYQTITVALQTFSTKTNFACSGVVEYTGSASLPVSIQFPNGQSFSFTYEDTPQFPGYKSGRLQRVTLPTGGYYEYTYPTTGNKGINCSDGTVTSLTRVINDGSSATWIFTRSPGSTSTTTENQPSGNWGMFSFNSSGQLVSEVTWQSQGGGPSIPLMEIDTTWAANKTPASRTVILYGGLQSKTETTFDSVGNLTELKESGFGQGTPGAIVRTTQIGYETGSAYLARNIRNRVRQIVIREGGATGTIKSQTDILYDEPAYLHTDPQTDCPAGALQHDDGNYGCSFYTRGNPTTVKTYPSVGDLNSPVTRNTSYDWFGNPRRAFLNGVQQQEWSYSVAHAYAYPNTTISGPAGNQLTTQVTYNTYTALVASVTDPNNKATSFSYDTMRRLTAVDPPDTAETTPPVTYGYDDNNRIVTQETPVQGSDKVRQRTYFDPLGRPFKRQVSDAAGQNCSERMIEYDNMGRPYRQSNPYTCGGAASHWTQTLFDALDRVLSVTAPDNSVTSSSYSGATVTINDPTGKQRKSEFDAFGRLVKVYEPDVNNNNALTQETSYAYNVLDLLTTVTQGVQTRTYNYDDLGRLLSASTPETNYQLVGYQYNDFGLVRQRTDTRGVITTYDYDGLNRLRQVSYNVGSTGVPATATVVYTYGTDPNQNNNGRLLTMTDGVGSETYTYDTLGRVTQVQKVISGATYTMGYEYNLAGELKKLTYPSGRQVEQQYDPIGRLTTVLSGTTNYASSFTYNPAGQVTGFNYGNGVTASLGYSPDRLQLQTLTHSKPGQTLFSVTYGYLQNGGNNGQITSIADNLDPTRSTTYSYDPLGRLKVAFAGPEANPTWKLDWDYDRYGNRPNQNVRAGSPPGPQLTIDPNTNRITGTGYGYDANGNITADGLNSLTYDAENRTVSVNGTTSYFYDGNSLRVKKVSGATTVYLFSGTKVIAEYENGAAPGNPTREYIYSESQLLAKIDGGATQYYHGDHLSVRVITDSNGTKIGERGHYPFGDAQPWYEAGTITKWKFTTYERDGESFNDYAMARSYINRFGRFASPDPVAGSVSDPQSLNQYTYVRNDPCSFSDPSGLCGVNPITGRPGVEGTTVTSPFGPRIHPITGEPQFHRGTDLAAAGWTPLYPLLPGRVVAHGETSREGVFVKVEARVSGIDYYYQYFHLYQAVVLPPTYSEGSIVAWSGDTGSATAPHLHLQIYRIENGQQVLVNPVDFLNNPCPGEQENPAPQNRRADALHGGGSWPRTRILLPWWYSQLATFVAWVQGITIEDVTHKIIYHIRTN